MNDTMVTLVGNVATAVEHRETPAGVPVARFRMATTSRRWDRARECWTDGETSFYTVRSWRALADNVAASVAVGEPVVVQGRLRLREGEQPPEKGGGRWFAAEIEALAIGHDLARGTSAFRRVARSRKEEVGNQPDTTRRDGTQVTSPQPTATQSKSSQSKSDQPNGTPPQGAQPQGAQLPGPQSQGPQSQGQRPQGIQLCNAQPIAEPWALEKGNAGPEPAAEPTAGSEAGAEGDAGPEPAAVGTPRPQGRAEDRTVPSGRAAKASGNSAQKVSVP
ncbi:single-stranded DNA-binding protein [Streptomyces sp. RS10V-4]|uniref:single-stranded DNA-binding protein n=1 Tax=Streptomyces rhizoryzae TaxID=2932493 RepID=UPI0020061206|nr:single-stranded DNA-binding protein [Streptomyces rhizoryzae]MCK7628185.1 single-stranded DNA-binding protein [Streptomyces rhizoryzae]